MPFRLASIKATSDERDTELKMILEVESMVDSSVAELQAQINKQRGAITMLEAEVAQLDEANAILKRMNGEKFDMLMDLERDVNAL